MKKIFIILCINLIVINLIALLVFFKIINPGEISLFFSWDDILLIGGFVLLSYLVWHSLTEEKQVKEDDED